MFVELIFINKITNKLYSGSAFTDKTLIQYLTESFGFDTSKVSINKRQ